MPKKSKPEVKSKHIRFDGPSRQRKPTKLRAHAQDFVDAQLVIKAAYTEEYETAATVIYKSPVQRSQSFETTFVQLVLDIASEHLRCAKNPVPLATVQTAFIKAIHRKSLRAGVLSFRVTEQDFLQEFLLSDQEAFKELLRCLFGTLVIVDRNSNVNICFNEKPLKLFLESDKPPKQSKSTSPPAEEPSRKKSRQDPPLLTVMREWDRRTDKGAQDDSMLLALTHQPSHLANEAGLHLETPLHLAAARGHAKLVAALLEAGSFPDVTDKQQNTPLHYATAAGHLECCKLLLQYGADASIRNRQGLRPIHYTTYKFAPCLRNGKPPHFPLQIIRDTLGDRIADHTAQRLLLASRALRRDALLNLTRVWVPRTAWGDDPPEAGRRADPSALMQTLDRYPAATTIGYQAPLTLQDGIALLTRSRLKSLHLHVSSFQDIEQSCLPVLARLTQLTFLHLKGTTPIMDYSPTPLPESLRALSLSQMGSFAADLLANMPHPLPHLHTLALHKLHITTSDIALLSTHTPQLTRLTVTRCRQLEDVVPFFFISSLQHLSIKQCPSAQQTNFEAVLMTVALISQQDAFAVRARYQELNSAGAGLRTLHLRGCGRPLLIPDLLKYTPNLRKLAIEDTELPKTTYAEADAPTHGLQHLSALTALTYLSFSGATLKIHLIGHLTSLHHLATLDLRGCSLPPRIVPELALLPALTSLNLAHWDVKKRLVVEAAEQLCRLSQLRFLGLGKRRLAEGGERMVAPQGGGAKSRRLWTVKVVRRALVRSLAKMEGLHGVDLWRWNAQEKGHFRGECGARVPLVRWRRQKVLYEEPEEGVVQ